MNELENPIIVGFPLKGEWLAPNTPGKMVPSHGTDQFGQRYAYDFIQIDWKRKGMQFYNSNSLKYFLFGVSLDNCYGWGKEVYAPCDGKIISAEDGYKERRMVHIISDTLVLYKHAFFKYDLPKKGLQPLLGNYVIMEIEKNIFALFAHLQTNSIVLSVGNDVKKGQVIGRVGHSGHSTAPHLHFQLMDSSNLLDAKGLPCVFEKYEVLKEGKWESVTSGIPTDKERIRYQGD